MAWRERRGYSLRLSQPRGGRDRLARLALVERDGLMRRWFNVREVRSSGRDAPRADRGRMLSWRPMSERDARDLLTARLSTLEALGYTVEGADERARDPFEALDGLPTAARAEPEPEPAVEIGIDEEGKVSAVEVPASAADAVEPEPDPEPEPEVPATVLAEEPGVTTAPDEPEALLEAMAIRVGLDPHRFAFPSVEDTRRVDAMALGDALDELVEHEHARLQTVAERWLTLPSTAYELDKGQIERWLLAGRLPGRWLAPRIPREGLALLGPEALRRLNQTSRSPRVRSFAGRWVERLYPDRGRA